MVSSFAGKKKYDGQLKSYSLKDKFFHFYGSQKQLLELHGISERKIYKFINGIKD